MYVPRDRTTLNGTPVMFIDICEKLKTLLPKSPELREGCSKVVCTLTGGSSCTPELVKALAEVFPNSGYVVSFIFTKIPTLLLKYNFRIMPKLSVGCLLMCSE